MVVVINVKGGGDAQCVHLCPSWMVVWEAKKVVDKTKYMADEDMYKILDTKEWEM